MSIKPEYLTLDELLQRRLFRIPNYQRAYSWETKQRQDLFDDISKLYKQSRDRHHFMSTVVCLRTEEREEIGTDEYRRFEVVDGQQRLTTLVVLLKAIAIRLKEDKDDQIAMKEAERLDNLLVKPEKRLILLQANHDSSMIFTQYLTHGKVPHISSVNTAAEKNLIRAFAECSRFVDSWTENHGLVDLLRLIKNRLDFIFYVLEDPSAVYTVFEVLNSRGLDVDPLDKCKSMLMGIAFEQLSPAVKEEAVDELHKAWGQVYRYIGSKDVPGDQILRYAATLKFRENRSKLLSDSGAIEHFRDVATGDPTRIVELSHWIVEVARVLAKVYANVRLRAVTSIQHARLLGVALELAPQLSEAERHNCLNQWERVSFRIFGMFRKDSRTKVGEYVRLSHDVVSGGIPYRDIMGRLVDIGEDHPIAQALDEVRTNDCYNGWEPELRYLLYRYEEHLARQTGRDLTADVWEAIWLDTPSTTIEHIHPQNTNASEWKGRFGSSKKKVEMYVNKLGNLLILPPKVNSQAGQKSFRDKKKVYSQHRLLMMDDVMDKKDWSRASVDEREDKILAWAEEAFSDLRTW